jgi:diguanylate cyclase (GGDEF)-like protein
LALHQEFDKRLAVLRHGVDATLMLLDLDGFKEINDTLGHHTGDLLLQQLGARLEDANETRRVFSARLGGDEFAIMQFAVCSPDQALEFAEEVLEIIRLPITVGDMDLSVDACIGISMSPAHGRDSHELLRCADVAMYHAKKSVGNVTMYGRELDPHTRERLSLMSDLKSALVLNQLVLHYQPKINLQTAEVSGVEALIRWNHPVNGMIPPDQFIPMAEVSPIINQISRWVIDEAIEQIRSWQQSGLDLQVAVNISARNLQDDNWCREVIELIQQRGVESRLIEFEITETVLMEEPEDARSKLAVLAETGLKVSIDDFGTGYSSLSYLQKLPIDCLKIDRSFVMDLDTGLNNKLIESIIGLARSLNLHVTAEGIENAQTMQELTAMGCDYGQGYHIARPMPATEFEEWIKKFPRQSGGEGNQGKILRFPPGPRADS